VALEAIARARRGDGPTLIEAETYRFRGHSLADPDELRSKEEKAKYQVCYNVTGVLYYLLFGWSGAGQSGVGDWGSAGTSVKSSGVRAVLRAVRGDGCAYRAGVSE
jgi:hypothetical protein